MTRTLNKLSEGDCAKVKKLMSIGSLRRRLQDLGIIDGTEIECVLKSPNGDPAAYLIKGTVIALRCEISSQIIVE